MSSSRWRVFCGLACVAMPPVAMAQDRHAIGHAASDLRVATFNVALNRAKAGQLVAELRGGKSKQAHAVAEIIQRVRPDVLVLNEVDHDAAGEAIAALQREYLGVAHGDAQAITFAHTFTAPVNTGEPSGLDLDGDGKTDGPGDAFGYGAFAGQYGMAVLSQHAIARDDVRTFRKLLWKDMPNARLPTDFYGEDARARLRLPSKSHWDVPIDVGGVLVHLLVSHPTPPVFDGPEDRNGKRNADEIRLWADYLEPARAGWIVDDQGRAGGLDAAALFVIAGDLNADPRDGDSKDAIDQLLRHARIDARQIPESGGGAEAATRQSGANARHRGDPRHDTGDFADRSVGNLRLDYVLPTRELAPTGSGVFWPTADDPLFTRLIGDGEPVISSDHRLVWLDVRLPAKRQTDVTELSPTQLRGQPLGDLTGARFLAPFTFAEHELTLIRWWTNGCPFCADSLPALDQLRQRYEKKGFAVVGMYHPKPSREVTDAEVRSLAGKVPFGGALAVDPEWSKLEELWARGAPRMATSISVLVDRAGKIVWVHPGPRLHPSDAPEHRAAARAFTDLEELLRARFN